MKRVYSANHLTDAHLVANLLQQSGIATRIFNEHAAGALGELPIESARPQVWVENPGHAALARDLIARYEAANIRTVPQDCPGCGESNPGNFETCWNCNSNLVVG